MRYQSKILPAALLLSAALYFSACNNPAAEKPATENSSATAATPGQLPEATMTPDLSYFKAYEGKYPREVKLLEDSILVPRLKALLGDRYDFLQQTWAVEVPIKLENEVLVASGCQQHNCSNTNFIIALDLAKNLLYAGVREEQQVKTYSEDGADNAAITDWATPK